MSSALQVAGEGTPLAIQLILVGKVSRTMLDIEFGKIGLSFPYGRILTTLAESGPKSATELCMLTMRERANMSVLLGKLKKIGYVQDTPSQLDARSQIVSLTEKGSEVAEQCKKITQETGKVIEEFMAVRTEDPTKFKTLMADFLNNFHVLYV
jgi:DNA-binding MarR family transcriptional regulator